MNEMYNMSIVTHNLGVIGILVVVLLNYLMLLKADNPSVYAKKMRSLLPLGSVILGSIIFTGTIMMAAKHLDFTIANIVMIVFALFFIVAEVKRAKKLRYLDIKQENAFAKYKSFANTILQIEFFVTLVISIWMLM